MNRRRVLQAGLAAGISARSIRPASGGDEGPRVMTVRGPIAPAEMGQTLPHEHILVDFVGAKEVSRSRYNADEVYRTALPHLLRIRDQGILTLVDCTPPYLGRDPSLLRRLSEASGLHILTPTGYYGASGSKYLPDHAQTESADELASRWLREWTDGIDGTGIRPGLIKLGTDAGPLPQVHRKLVRAAAAVHLASGLTIAMHSGDGTAALDAIQVVREMGVHGSAFIWVHAGADPDGARHVRAAESGAWVEFDSLGPGQVDRHVELVRAMKRSNHLDRVLLSHDAGWYHVGEPGGGEFRPFTTLCDELIPGLRKAGLTDAEVRRLTVDNPRDAFTVRGRRG